MGLVQRVNEWGQKPAYGGKWWFELSIVVGALAGFSMAMLALSVMR